MENIIFSRYTRSISFCRGGRSLPIPCAFDCCKVRAPGENCSANMGPLLFFAFITIALRAREKLRLEGITLFLLSILPVSNIYRNRIKHKMTEETAIYLSTYKSK